MLPQKTAMKDSGKGGRTTNYTDIKKSSMFQSGNKWRGQRDKQAPLDRDILGRKIEERTAKYGGFGGEMGVYNLAYVDSSGKPILDQPIPFGKRVFYPNPKGNFRILDKDYFEEERQLAKERRDYFKKLTHMAYEVGDDALAHMLGITDADQFKVIFAGDIMESEEFSNWVKVSHPAGIPTEISKAEARPSILQLLPEDSEKFLFGIAKLQLLMEYFNPLMEDDEAGDDPNEKAEDPSVKIKK